MSTAESSMENLATNLAKHLSRKEITKLLPSFAYDGPGSSILSQLKAFETDVVNKLLSPDVLVNLFTAQSHDLYVRLFLLEKAVNQLLTLAESKRISKSRDGQVGTSLVPYSEFVKAAESFQDQFIQIVEYKKAISKSIELFKDKLQKIVQTYTSSPDNENSIRLSKRGKNLANDIDERVVLLFKAIHSAAAGTYVDKTVPYTSW